MTFGSTYRIYPGLTFNMKLNVQDQSDIGDGERGLKVGNSDIFMMTDCYLYHVLNHRIKYYITALKLC